ncbi:MAG: AraC family transcriptional regulator [Pseudomonadota bacterium]
MKPVFETIRSGDTLASFHVFEVQLASKPSHWHYHPELELTWVISGQGTRFVGEHIGPFSPGDVMLTGSNLPHDFNVQEAAEPTKFLVVQFKSNLLAALPEMAPVAEMFERARRGLLFEAVDRSLSEPLAQLTSYSSAQQCVCVLDTLRRVGERDDGRLLCDDTYAPPLLAQAQLSRLNQVIDYVRDHYNEAIALDDMTELTSMTPTSFCRWFRKTMDCSFFSYVNHYRVEQASRLLLSSDQPINVIARDCGFDTISSFNRWFQRRTGVAPRTFRQRVANQSTG